MKKKNNVKIDVPSDATLRRLFAATEAFRLLAPWRWMGDREVVAVRDPLSERIAYCVVMGGEGTCFGMEAMLGDRGLLAYRKTASDGRDTHVGIDALHMKDSILFFLDKAKDLATEDIALLRRVGIVPSSSHAWPRFRRFEPGFYPWFMEERDVVFMAVCLEQVVEVAFRAMKDPAILGPRNYKTFCARIPVQMDGKVTWKDEIITPEPLERVIRIQPKVDLASLGQVLSSAGKSGLIWEADCFFGQMPIAGPNERPRYPLCYMIADKDSGFVFDVNLFDINDYGAAFLDRIMQAIKQHKIMPSEIHIRQVHLEAVFAPLAAYGIKIKVVKDLPMINTAKEEMFKVFDEPLRNVGARSSKKKGVKTSTLEKVKSSGKTIYQFKVTLNHVAPPVWRRFQVRSDITLHRLSTTILLVMGWDGGHLHQFRIGGVECGIPHEDYQEDDQLKDEREIILSDIPQEALKKFTYEYDFGDGWEHTVILEKVLDPVKGVKYPVCLEGERSCPPEDCGGPHGYEDFLKAIKDKKHPEHKSMLEWIGGEFDSEEFDVDFINDDLKHIDEEEEFLDGDEEDME